MAERWKAWRLTPGFPPLLGNLPKPEIPTFSLLRRRLFLLIDRGLRTTKTETVYTEILTPPVVRMLLAEVVARLNLGLALGEDLLQLLDQLLQLCSSKFFAEPKDQACYVGHGGEPLGNLAGSLHVVLGIKRETPPPFSFSVKPVLPIRAQPGEELGGSERSKQRDSYDEALQKPHGFVG